MRLHPRRRAGTFGLGLRRRTPPSPVKQVPAATCVDTKTNVKLDCASTGSVEKKGATENTVDGKGPRLGISINPWIVPSAF